MNATVQSKKDRPNYYIVLDYNDALGNRKRKWITTDIPVKGDNKRRAEKKRKEVLAEYEKLEIDLSNDVLFTEFIRQWLENMRFSIDTVTYDGYKLVIYNQVVPFFEPKKLRVKDVTPMHIQQYVNYKLNTLSPNTVRKHLWNVSKCFDDAVRKNLIAFNPAKRIELPKLVKFTGAQYYNETQLEKLLEAIKGDTLEDVIKITLFYGLRRSETIGIKWDSIDFENNTLTIKHTVVQMGTKMHKKDSTKTSSSYRTMPLTDNTRKIFKDIRRNQLQARLLQPNDYIDEGYVFTREDGSLIAPNYVTRHFKRLLINSSLPVIRFHDLRHSSASYLLSLGFSMKQIQDWLGHATIGTTMNIYAHLDASSKQNIADTLNEKLRNFN